MPISIKNAAVERLARDLAAKTGDSLTHALQVALEERLARLKAGGGLAALHADIDRIIGAYQGLPLLDGRSVQEIEADLYDEDGLPR